MYGIASKMFNDHLRFGNAAPSLWRTRRAAACLSRERLLRWQTRAGARGDAYGDALRAESPYVAAGISAPQNIHGAIYGLSSRG
jgi:hypothetical protein